MVRLRTVLGQRAVAPATAAEAGEARPITLAELPPGSEATVVNLSTTSGPTIARRLFDLGFAPGTEVTVVRRAPLVDPVIFRVAGYDVTLRRLQARLIIVTVNP